MNGASASQKIFLFGMISLVFTFAVHAQAPERTKADTNREVVRTYAEVYLEAKNYAQAEKSLLEYLAKDNQDPVLWNLLGIAQISLKKIAPSCYAFRKAAELFPAGEPQANALYNFADCLNQGGKTDDAKQTLKIMKDRGGEGKWAAENVLNQYQRGEIKPGDSLPAFAKKEPNHLRLSGALAVGYDTNVLLVDNLTASTGGGVTGQGSLFFTPAVQASYWGKIFNQRYDTLVTTAFTNYTGEQAKTFNLLYERADMLVGSGSFRYGLTQEMAFLNRDPFQLYFLNGGFALQKKVRINETEQWDFDLPIKYRYFYFDRTTTDENKRTGIQVNARVQYLKILFDDLRYASRLGLSTDFASGQNYKMTELAWANNALISLPGLKSFGLTNSFGVEVAGQYYWKSEYKRKDLALRLNAGLMKTVFTGFRTNLDYGYQSNFSNLDLAKYKKHMVTLTVSYDFI